MKKLAFIFSLIILLIALKGLEFNKRKNMTLKVAFPYNKEVSFYEPTKIHLAPEYIFLENTFSPLIELDPKEGTPSGGIAERFDWDEDELHLYLRKNLKTIDGYTITAHDAEFSFKRLLVLSSNTHGNFKSVICPDDEFTDISSKCNGIEVIDDYHLLLKVKGKKQFLAKMLAAIDFAIIPKTSVDPKTLKIIDYRNTSGPFYVEKSTSDGHITLKPNPYHYHYTKDLPEKVELIPSGLNIGKNSLEMFKNNEVDHITTIDDLKPNKVIDFAEKNSDASLHSSLQIRTFALFFTQKGIKRFSHDERIAIGKSLRASLESQFLKKSGYKRRHQLFPQFGDGGLNDNEMRDVENTYKNNNLIIKDDILLSIIRVGEVQEFQEALKSHKNVIVKEGQVSDAFGGDPDSKDFPDVFLAGPDVSFMEDVGLITYTVNAGLIGIPKDERAAWLKSYMEMEDKKDRINKLKQVHKNALLKGFIVPYASSPYVALTRKGWSADLPEIVGNHLLWKIRKD